MSAFAALSVLTTFVHTVHRALAICPVRVVKAGQLARGAATPDLSSPPISARVRKLLLSLLLLPAIGAHAQVTCLFTEDFSAAELPSGWSMEPATVVDANGGATAPWRTGTAAEANTAGYFPLPDDPVGDRCALANDDAAPCDCAMSGVSLITPEIDLAGSTHAGLRCRIYHDGRPANTHARIEASPDGTVWNTLFECPPVLGVWQEVLLNLDAYAGGPVRLRFTYDDAGTWASGMAVDDVCVFDRPAHDVALGHAVLGDATISAFITGDRALPYSHLPLEQAAPLLASVRVRNLGSEPAQGMSLALEAQLNGTTVWSGTSAATGSLAPLADTTWVVNTGWTPDATGDLSLQWTLTTTPSDVEPADNVASAAQVITGLGVVNNSMALDNGLPEALLDNGGEGFSAGCRFELLGGASIVHGLAVKVGDGTTPGALVTALLADGELNVLSAGAPDTLTEADVALCTAGGWHYLAFPEPVAVPADADVVGLVRYDPGNGALRFAAGGVVPQGSAWVVGSDGFSITYPLRAPHVRLLLQEAVTGIAPARSGSTGVLTLVADPASQRLVVLPTGTGRGVVETLDATGRFVQRSEWNGAAPLAISTSDWSTGIYTVMFRGLARISFGRTLVHR